jgi:hypothetical protein
MEFRGSEATAQMVTATAGRTVGSGVSLEVLPLGPEPTL